MTFKRFAMSASSQVLDGVFAVNKPTGMTSADICNEVKYKLSKSSLFAPVMEAQSSQRDDFKRRGQRLSRKMRQTKHVKIGHGGTLDPEASGVISFGVGDGTKALNHLQKNAKKGYEAVMVFGVATDSFDREGKVVGRKSWDGVTRDVVEARLAEFRGKVMQRPSVYSALSRGGVKMYEYARQGKDIPELEKREMFVSELEVVDWMEGGKHDWRWPSEEIEKDRKDAFVKALRFEEIGGVEVVEGSEKQGLEHDESEKGKGKRKRDANGYQDQKRSKVAGDDQPEAQDKDVSSQDRAEEHDTLVDDTRDDPAETTPAETTPAAAQQDEAKVQVPCPAPALRIRMVVSSGFYVRSLCHDLGVAVGSLATMVALNRTKQACFELGENVIDYEDFSKGEDVWGPKVAARLNEWPSLHAKLKEDEGPAVE
ncbi:pseudouridine synthase [Elsinoe ampelina]|uniref:tRNA pseudouridine(55) synthase n=1 Tax=Elsinoe ampelina TaxID=302913 RepID=A0A6A6GJM0_9PEZI|nr:pseudouridine synthase [Elsinoe ampelina]